MSNTNTSTGTLTSQLIKDNIALTEKVQQQNKFIKLLIEKLAKKGVDYGRK